MLVGMSRGGCQIIIRTILIHPVRNEIELRDAQIAFARFHILVG